MNGDLPMAFDVWLRDARFNASDLRRNVVESAATADRILSDYANTHPQDGLSITTVSGRGAVMASAAAGACHSALPRRLRKDVEGKNILRVAAAAVHEATETPLPGGFVGSCVGASSTAQLVQSRQHGPTTIVAASASVPGIAARMATRMSEACSRASTCRGRQPTCTLIARPGPKRSSHS